MSIKYEDVPELWHGRCSGDGHEKHKNKDGEWVYDDNNELVGEFGIRPCAKCGEYPSIDGDDYCISNLGAVMNACCGHGKNKGYIQFDSGVIVRGDFEIEKFEPYEMPYIIRPRQEIEDKLKKLESKKGINYKREIDILEWVMQVKY